MNLDVQRWNVESGVASEASVHLPQAPLASGRVIVWRNGTPPTLARSTSDYAEAAHAWLHSEAEVIDTTELTPAQAARQIADALIRSGRPADDGPGDGT